MDLVYIFLTPLYFEFLEQCQVHSTCSTDTLIKIISQRINLTACVVSYYGGNNSNSCILVTELFKNFLIPRMLCLQVVSYDTLSEYQEMSTLRTYITPSTLLQDLFCCLFYHHPQIKPSTPTQDISSPVSNMTIYRESETLVFPIRQSSSLVSTSSLAVEK